MSLLTVIAVITIVAVGLKRVGWSPATIGGLAWACICVTSWLDPLGISAPIPMVQWMIVIGVACLLAPSIAAGRSGDRSALRLNQLDPEVLAIWTIAVGVIAVIGAIKFQTQISAASGSDYSSLSASEIRRAQTGAARGGGLVSLFQASYPLLGCLSVLGLMRSNRWYLIGLGVVLWASYQNPARTVLLSLIAVVATFYFYARAQSVHRDGTQRRFSARTYAGAAAVMGVMLTVFIVVGNRLGKNDQAIALYPDAKVPSSLTTPVLYLTGGMSAISNAIRYNAAPYDEKGSSAYLIERAWQSISPLHHAPDTIGNYISIPTPFNVFTGFGQAWWDFGWIGLAGLSVLLGVISAWSHRSATRGNLAGMWVSAVCVSLMVSLPLEMRLFNLDVVFQLSLGLIAFSSISVRAQRPSPNDSRLRSGKGPSKAKNAQISSDRS